MSRLRLQCGDGVTALLVTPRPSQPWCISLPSLRARGSEPNILGQIAPSEIKESDAKNLNVGEHHAGAALYLPRTCTPLEQCSSISLLGKERTLGLHQHHEREAAGAPGQEWYSAGNHGFGILRNAAGILPSRFRCRSSSSAIQG